MVPPMGTRDLEIGWVFSQGMWLLGVSEKGSLYVIRRSNAARMRMIRHPQLTKGLLGGLRRTQSTHVTPSASLIMPSTYPTKYSSSGASGKASQYAVTTSFAVLKRVCGQMITRSA
jgi:hypothetical protein